MGFRSKNRLRVGLNARATAQTRLFVFFSAHDDGRLTLLSLIAPPFTDVIRTTLIFIMILVQMQLGTRGGQRYVTLF